MSEFSLSDFHDLVWSHLSRGVADRHHPARHPTLATIGPDGPQARTLVLRSAARETAVLGFFTDGASTKVGELETDPRAAIHIWVPKAQLQIRATGIAEILPGDPQIFASLPPEAQANYTGLSPGTPLHAKVDNSQPRLTNINVTLLRLDVVLLTHPHRRAFFEKGDDWAGVWVAP